jgi:hypothetical protein
MSDPDSATVTSNTSTIQTTLTGRGHGQGRGPHHDGRGGRNNRKSRSGKRTARSQGPVSKNSSFKGNTTDMNGHVFECYEERGDRTQFAKTLEALGENAAKNLKYPEDLKCLFEENMSAPDITEPADLPTTPTKKQELIWESALKSIHVESRSCAAISPPFMP